MEHFFHIITSSRAATELGHNLGRVSPLVLLTSGGRNDNSLKYQLVCWLYQMFLLLFVKLICNSEDLRCFIQ